MKKVTSISLIVKDIVLVGGYNVYPREVEEVLYTHESVAEVVVIGVPDENLGEAVRAYVVLKQTNVTEEELMHYCTLHLAKYKVPKSIEFLIELPKNTTGKLLRRALREKAMCKNEATIFEGGCLIFMY